jgi:hypothetical protein
MPDLADTLRQVADYLEAGAPVPAHLVAELRAWLAAHQGAPVAKPPVPPPQYRRRSL